MLVRIVTQAKSSNFSTSKPLLFNFSIMRKAFCIPLLLLVTFFYATSVLARNDPSGNEVNTEGKLANEGVTKPSLEGPNEDEKFKGLFHLKHKLKGYFHKKPIYYKPIPKYIPTYKPFHKPIIGEKPIPSVVEPEAFLKHKHYFFKKPIVPIVKPVYVPIYKPVPKVIPIYKPIPVYKPIPKVIPIVKPIH